MLLLLKQNHTARISENPTIMFFTGAATRAATSRRRATARAEPTVPLPALYRGQDITYHHVIERPVDDPDFIYSDSLMFNLRCTLMRVGKKGWERFSTGTLHLYEERDSDENHGRLRVKWVQDAFLKVQMHIYVQRNMPAPQEHSEKPDRAHVIHAWSSTGERNRTCFALTFSDENDAKLFDAVYIRWLALASATADREGTASNNVETFGIGDFNAVNDSNLATEFDTCCDEEEFEDKRDDIILLGDKESDDEDEEIHWDYSQRVEDAFKNHLN